MTSPTRELVTFLSTRGDLPDFLPTLLRLVASGEPVPVEAVAAATGAAAGEVESWLRNQPGTDWDEHGRLVGFGLTQLPTRHRFVVDRHTLYTFCAADTLLFPPILGRAARVESTCPATRRTIRVDVTPDAVITVDPATAVVTQVGVCAGVDDIRGEICDHGHFYASADATASWRTDHPGGAVIPVRAFFAEALAALTELGWAA